MVRKSNAKKTKSRNGCGRCKLKRLKCDETAPSCLQCTKRNSPCPGYEKALRWSTKYEVLSLPKPKSSPSSAVGGSVNNVASETPPSIEIPVCSDISTGIQAMAAVLPTVEKKPVRGDHDIAKLATPPTPSSDSVPGCSLAPRNQVDSLPPELGSVFGDDLDIVDPTLFDAVIEPDSLLDEDLDMDLLQSLDFGNGQMGEAFFDYESVSQERYSACLLPSVPSNTNTREGHRNVNPRLSRSLLLDFYRLPSPSPDPLLGNDMEALLIHHYFKVVCSIFSSFDSVLNPFRTAVGQSYRSCPSIKYGIQSMAAAHLANTFPSMAAVGLEMQQNARNALETELPLTQRGQGNVTKTFLSILLLGLTASWHDSSALGIEHLSMARSLILPRLLSRSDEQDTQREAQFFEESLIHWEMLIGFVSEDAISFSSPSGSRSTRLSENRTPPCRRDGRIVPHPWTGIAPMIHFLFAETGRLVRRECALNRNSSKDFKRKEENLQNAASLEEDLLAADYPSVETIADTCDERTPREHFVLIAEVYRCAGLLEIYRTFPSVLHERLKSNDVSKLTTRNLDFPMPRFDTAHEATDVKLWLNSLAMHILWSMETLPSSSGTFCIQPLLLIVAASELKFVPSVDFFDPRANETEVRAARDFVTRRLREYSLRLPNKPLQQMIRLIQETWRRSDEGEDAFWIDVMNEKGWHTIL